MSYLKKIEYEIILKDSFWGIRNCPKCGRKTYFKNTRKFLVNTNGNKLENKFIPRLSPEIYKAYHSHTTICLFS